MWLYSHLYQALYLRNKFELPGIWDLIWELVVAVIPLKLLSCHRAKTRRCHTETVLIPTCTYSYTQVVFNIYRHTHKYTCTHNFWREISCLGPRVLSPQAPLIFSYLYQNYAELQFFPQQPSELKAGSGKCSAATQWLLLVLPISSYQVKKKKSS